MANTNDNRTNFTHARVERFACSDDKSEAFLWDAKTPGLGIRARRTGGKQYVFQSRLHNKTVRQTIGKTGSHDIDEARAEARRLRVLIDAGIHPRDERKQREAEDSNAEQARRRETVTLGDVWPTYIEARKGDWGDAHRHDHERAMQAPGQPRKYSKKFTKAGPLYALRDERLADLTAERLLTWLEREKQARPTAASLAYRLLRAFLSWLEEQPQYRGLADTQRVLTKTVRRAVPKPKAKDDVLQREQLALWFEAVRGAGRPIMAAYFQALLLTGARSGEMARLRWIDTDFDWRSLTIRDKVDGERTIPLTPYLAQLLAALPRRNAYVFASSTSKSGYLADGSHRHTRIIETAGLPHVTLHGLRRSFGTLSEWVECPVGVVAQIQGHKPSALAEKHYRRRPLDLLRLWHTRIEGWVLNQAGIEQPDEQAETGLRLIRDASVHQL